MKSRLVTPNRDGLAGYEAALATGWSPNNVRDVSAEQLAALRADREAFLDSLVRQGGTIDLGDGRVVPKLPFHPFWIWDGAFCGVIGLRFQPGTDALPPHVLGHIGFAVVPWKRRRGYARQALADVLPVAREVGLRRVLLTCDHDNAASRGVIEANGGVLSGEEPAETPEGKRKLLFWIEP
jgi:predicted acetyltransferase